MQHVFVGKLFKVGRLRRVIAAVIPASGATAFVGVVAASLMTITSITFTVLLTAVQQTSNFLGAVVFDQYLRRLANQVSVGYFVGATAFSFIVLACAGSGSPPVIGAFVALVLTAGCLVALLLLTGTRKTRRTAPDAAARVVTAETGGYVVDVDPRALAAVARSAGPDVEVFLPCLLGTYVASGESLASIVGVAADDDRFDADARVAVTLDDSRRVEVDSGYSIDQLHTIAWTGTCGQSPLIASAAIHQLRDLLGQWAGAEEQTLDTSESEGEPLLVSSFPQAVPRLGSDEHRVALTAALDAAIPTMRQQADSSALEKAVTELVDVLVANGLDHRAAGRLQADIGAAARVSGGELATR